jgi:4-aminobutyrate aminotransferase-like enzyme
VLSARSLYAQEFLKEYPEPDRVMHDIQGSDALDTAARRYAALHFLAYTIQFRGGYFGPALTAPAKAKMDAYNAAADSVNRQAYSMFDPNCKGDNCERSRYVALRAQYDEPEGRNGPGPFDQEILKRYFSAQWRRDYNGAHSPHPSPGGEQ